MRHAILLFVPLVLSFTGCQIVGEEEPAPEIAAAVYAQRTCGPTDGPALELIVLDSVLACENVNQLGYGDNSDRAFTRIFLWGLGEPAPGVWTVGGIDDDPSYYSGGWGQSCPGSGAACVNTERAVVSFTAAGADSFAVTAQITLPGGRHQNVAAGLRVCPVQILCG
ncbi:MAG: hypothetical protein R2834_18775 [Rhodothermales bacterium]